MNNAPDFLREEADHSDFDGVAARESLESERARRFTAPFQFNLTWLLVITLFLSMVFGVVRLYHPGSVWDLLVGSYWCAWWLAPVIATVLLCYQRTINAVRIVCTGAIVGMLVLLPAVAVVVSGYEPAEFLYFWVIATAVWWTVQSVVIVGIWFVSVEFPRRQEALRKQTRFVSEQVDPE